MIVAVRVESVERTWYGGPLLCFMTLGNALDLSHALKDMPAGAVGGFEGCRGEIVMIMI